MLHRAEQFWLEQIRGERHVRPEPADLLVQARYAVDYLIGLPRHVPFPRLDEVTKTGVDEVVAPLLANAHEHHAVTLDPELL